MSWLSSGLLVSVYDKTGLVEFAQQLAVAGVEIVSTGGTAKLLRDAGVRVRDVAELTGWPEMLGCRVEGRCIPRYTAASCFAAGEPKISNRRARREIAPIDLVVVNLYPFEATAARPNLTAEELNRGISISAGRRWVRSAAKNFESVARW